MSLNKVKSLKSKLAKWDVFSLRFMLKKVKSEKLAIIKKWQENTEVFEKVEECLKLEIENGKKEMKQVVTSYNNIFEKLKENLECPVCMEIPRSGPVFACPNGHFVCKKCKSGSCPTCRVEMGNGKSLLAVTVIENIDHKCKFAECEELFAKDKLEAHENICKFRIVKCPYSSCGVEVALSKLVDHLGQQNTCCLSSVPTVIPTSSKTGTASFKVNNLTEFQKHQLSWTVVMFSYRDTNFAVTASKTGDYYHFTMVMFESEEVCSKYKIDMEVHERDSSFQDSELSIRFRGNPRSIEENKSDVKFLGLTVHHKVMEEVIKRNNDLVFTVSFSFSEKRAREPEGLE